ncbi:MAG TPA: PhoU domain-containing protein, partial [Candidatus Cloacimonadota bacterium]|nr:PhoU domain-containing protein [Candidatus Cloacimonadota bacterium]
MQSDRIEELKNKLLDEAEMVQNMLNIALVTQDPESGFRRVSALEDTVNALEKEIDELAIRLIALYQPEAGDLRR